MHHKMNLLIPPARRPARFFARLQSRSRVFFLDAMPADLIDVRCKITDEADAVLEARHRATGRDRSELIREVLHAWATDQIHEARVLADQLAAKGLRGIEGGARGNVRERGGQ